MNRFVHFPVSFSECF